MRLPLAALLLIPLLVASVPKAAAVAPRAPELPSLDAGHWLNSAPLTLAALRGRPVLIDNGYAYWRSLDNQYWPAFYLINAEGRIVDTQIGELHAGDRRADAFEAAIARLLGVVR